MVWAAAGLAALFYIAPGLNTPLFYLQQNTLHLGTREQGYLVFLNAGGGMAAAVLYGFFAARRLSLRSLLCGCLFFSAPWYTSTPQPHCWRCRWRWLYPKYCLPRVTVQSKRRKTRRRPSRLPLRTVRSPRGKSGSTHPGHTGRILKERSCYKDYDETFKKSLNSLRFSDIVRKTVEPLKLPHSTGKCTCAETQSTRASMQRYEHAWERCSSPASAPVVEAEALPSASPATTTPHRHRPARRSSRSRIRRRAPSTFSQLTRKRAPQHRSPAILCPKGRRHRP